MPRNALIIKGVNFSAHKVSTITIVTEEKPCTGIVLDQSSKTITALGSFSLVPTVTPADTTDDIYWATTDDAVATVEDGTVTIVGVGTATITASCGNFSATCEIDASEIEATYTPNFFNTSALANVAVRTTTGLGYITLYRPDLYGEILGFRTGDGINGAPIPLPNNVDHVVVTANNMYSDVAHCFWLDTNTPASDTYSDSALLILDDNTKSTASGEVSLTYTKPEGANAIAMKMRMKTAASAMGETAARNFVNEHGITLKFYAATS